MAPDGTLGVKTTYSRVRMVNEDLEVQRRRLRDMERMRDKADMPDALLDMVWPVFLARVDKPDA